MTREEEIKKQADIYTDDASNYAEWSDDGGWSDTNDIELIEKAFTLIAFQTLFEWFGVSDNWAIAIILFLVAWMTGFISHLND